MVDRIYVSSSIENFAPYLLEATGIPRWERPSDESCVFFGLYGPRDYKRFLRHKGHKKVMWAGSDILYLAQWRNLLWRLWIRCVKAEHVVENSVEQAKLAELGIESTVLPIAWFDISGVRATFAPSDAPEVYMNVHKGREAEYGLYIAALAAVLVPDVKIHVYGECDPDLPMPQNIILHGRVPNNRFNKETANMQGGLRLNRFDGFGEILVKSVLRGQYPISRIRYKHIDYVEDFDDLVRALEDLKNKKGPNDTAREYWHKTLTNNLQTLLS